MKNDEIKKIVQDPKGDRWLIWAGYILSDNEKEREIEYYGKFAKSKTGAIGAAKLLMNNTSPYRIIIQDTKPFKIDPALLQTELAEFFPLERE